MLWLVHSGIPSLLPRPRSRVAPRTALPRAGHATGVLSDYGFLHLLNRYRGHGGLARAAQVVTRLERGMGLDADLLSRWQYERRAICFEWQGELWLPWFQFLRGRPLPDPAVGRIVALLSAVINGAEIATWFGTPSSALSGHAPAEMIDLLPAAVLDAARRERLR
jgi:hypothetical protein